MNSGRAASELSRVQRTLRTTSTHADQVEKSTGKATKSIQGISAPAEKSAKSMATLAKHALEAVAAFEAFHIAVEAVKEVVELGHATERLTAITGLNAKQASSWIETMKVRGVQTKAVSMAFITLSRNVRTAQDADAKHVTAIASAVKAQKLQRDALEATGASHQRLTVLEQQQKAALDKLSGPSTNKAVAAFVELGVKQDVLRSKSPEKVLLAVADGMEKITDPARRAALAQQIFGRGAQALIPILEHGRKGVEDALATTQKYGAFLPKNVKGINSAVEAQRGLNLAMDGLKISFATAVLPSLVQGAEKLLAFIAQMRSGRGAGGQFADAISSAFRTVKTAVTNIVGAVGGLGNAVRIAVGAFAAVKIIEFGKALQALFTVIRESPVGAFFTVVGLLAGVMLSLSNRQHTAAETARQVADAWDQARTSAAALRDANLQVVQATLDHKKADEALIQAERDKKKAADDYGTKSPQYKAAEEQLAQAKIDSKRASNDLADANRNVSKTQKDATSDRQKAIDVANSQVAGDRARITRIQAEIDHLQRLGVGQQHNTTGSNALKDARNQLAGATQKLTRDQDALNQKIIAMPSKKLSDIEVGVNFVSNISNAIGLIAAQVGGHFEPLKSHPAFHYAGGMVTQPGYFAGEEAPQHPEVILATNPAYRERNLGLWAQAGSMLGVPGFAQGGLSSVDAKVVGGTGSWMAKAAGSWMKGRAAAWVEPVKKAIIAMTSVGGNAAANAQLWIQGGGPAAVAQIAGAIAMAESGGKDIVQKGQPYGSTGWGRWQITPGNSEPQFGIDQALLIPINNAHAAVAKYNQAGGSFRPWTTYTSGAYKRFLGGAATVGGAVGIGGGLGSFDGLPVASWIVPELVYAQRHGWHGRITSGYRPGFDPFAPSGSEHARTVYPGGAVDFGGMRDPAGYANRAAFEAATAGYRGLRLVPPIGFRDDGHMSGTGHRRGGIHGRMIRGLGKHFAKGGIHGKIPGFKTGGTFSSSKPKLVGGVSKGIALPAGATVGALPSAGSILGLPALPSGGTLTVPSKISGIISGHRTTISTLERDFGSIDSYYSQIDGSLSFIDPDTGQRNEKAIATRVQQLNVLIAYRQRIFNLWSHVVALTQRLISANEKMVRGFKVSLASISTKGLKGSALRTAQKRIADAKTAIAKFSGNASSARGDLISAVGDRQSAWISLQGLLGEKFSIAGTVAQAASSAIDATTGAVDTTGGTLDNAPVTDTGTIQALQTLLMQANQRTAVSEAQFGVLSKLPFGGSFATGGIVPGPIGAPSVIVAHGGEAVGGTPQVTLHFADGMGWLKQFIQVEVSQAGRSSSRTARRQLPGSTGR